MVNLSRGGSPTRVVPGAEETVVFRNVSKFYGEVLGVNRVNLTIEPGITSLVGPNGSGKTTLMNLMTGLLRPTEGTVRVLGLPPHRPQALFGLVGYCTQYDTFPKGLTGFSFLYHFARLHAPDEQARRLVWQALERVNMVADAHRRVAAYSKGMRQRIKLAHALCHQPAVLVLDEPLNGLDPIGRAEMIELFKELGREGRHVIISSHILHEVDVVSDRVILLDQGYVVAEGTIEAVRREVTRRPMQILVRCDRAALVASRALGDDHVTAVQLHDDRAGLHVSTRDPDGFFHLLNRLVVEEGVEVESVAPADEDVHAVYRYVIGDQSD